ncbi:MAG: hypothetical protein HDR18_09650 [Lachnospiraceae bacterium]|nr:hypothetical protein [Lachnospiraceae bacterium]MBD5485757.1 hypothetical protein [Lachnospiraceae bacterium]MBD5504403.1 hypothetical protein [Lachnospiraceae bacterium]
MDEITAMKQVLDSMEDVVRLRSQARAERRAEEAEAQRRDFQEKLQRAAASKIELDSISSGVKGKQDAVQRDQLIGLMMAGF